MSAYQALTQQCHLSVYPSSAQAIDDRCLAFLRDAEESNAKVTGIALWLKCPHTDGLAYFRSVCTSHELPLHLPSQDTPSSMQHARTHGPSFGTPQRPWSSAMGGAANVRTGRVPGFILRVECQDAFPRVPWPWNSTEMPAVRTHRPPRLRVNFRYK